MQMQQFSAICFDEFVLFFYKKLLHILIDGFVKRFNCVKKKTQKNSKAPISRKCSQDKKKAK